MQKEKGNTMNKKIQLFCIPYAGGNADFFDGFANAIGGDIEVVPLEYAGHGKRRKEPFYMEFQEMVEDVAKLINEKLNPKLKTALFGYSMGSVVAYELFAQKILDKKPDFMFFASHEAPDVEWDSKSFFGFTDERFFDMIQQMGGFERCTVDMLQNRFFRKLHFEPVKADYILLGHYKMSKQVEVDVPSLLFYSASDIPREKIVRWKPFLGINGQMIELGDGHFFIRQCQNEMVQAMRSVMMKEEEMKVKLADYLITPDLTILDALKKIDDNKKGFVVIVDEAYKVLGTLTDGDIRRLFIGGHTVEEKLDGLYRSDITVVVKNDSMATITELFKKSSIKFLPIVDENGIFTNLITKDQMHSMLLQDIQADFNYDFFSLDENIVNHEIFLRPWGFYKTTVYNDYYQAKILSVNPKSQLSLQSHNHREEHWIVVHGTGTVQVGESIIHVHCGSSLFIPKGCKHRLTNTDDKESLIISEIQLGDYLGEDDIVRYDDIYGRI